MVRLHRRRRAECRDTGQVAEAVALRQECLRFLVCVKFAGGPVSDRTHAPTGHVVSRVKSPILCPCRSGALAQTCCLGVPSIALSAIGTDRRPKFPFLAPHLPPTGEAMLRCYASPLASCGGPLTREHWSTRSVLEQMPVIVLTGAKWHGPGEIRAYSADNLAAHVLCRVHNNALSPVDTEAGRFYGALNGLVDPRPGEVHRIREFSGHLLERWALKLLCGILAAGTVAQADPTPRGWKPPRVWLECLYGLAPFPGTQGLYARRPRGTQTGLSARSIKIELIKATATNQVIGCDLVVSGLFLRLSMADLDSWDEESRFDLVYRPAGFGIYSPTGTGVLALDWSGDPAGERVDVHLEARS